jgi:hypothetical protein
MTAQLSKKVDALTEESNSLKLVNVNLTNIFKNIKRFIENRRYLFETDPEVILQSTPVN